MRKKSINSVSRTLGFTDLDVAECLEAEMKSGKGLSMDLQAKVMPLIRREMKLQTVA